MCCMLNDAQDGMVNHFIAENTECTQMTIVSYLTLITYLCDACYIQHSTVIPSDHIVRRYLHNIYVASW